jgi:hypothetical protein
MPIASFRWLSLNYSMKRIAIIAFSASSKESGFSKKANQLQATSDKLSVALTKVAELF